MASSYSSEDGRQSGHSHGGRGNELGGSVLSVLVVLDALGSAVRVRAAAELGARSELLVHGDLVFVAAHSEDSAVLGSTPLERLGPGLDIARAALLRVESIHEERVNAVARDEFGGRVVFEVISPAGLVVVPVGLVVVHGDHVVVPGLVLESPGAVTQVHKGDVGLAEGSRGVVGEGTVTEVNVSGILGGIVRVILELVVALRGRVEIRRHIRQSRVEGGAIDNGSCFSSRCINTFLGDNLGSDEGRDKGFVHWI